MKLSKLAAARRQLLAALHIHWYLDEPLAVYTLAANAGEICDTLLRLANKTRIVDEVIRVHGTTARAITDLLNSPRNFVKHADRDPQGEMGDLTPEDCDTILLTACIDYTLLAQRAPLAVNILPIWFSAAYPTKAGSFLRDTADELFPGLAAMSRGQQVLKARDALEEQTSLVRDMRSELTDNFRWVELRRRFKPIP